MWRKRGSDRRIYLKDERFELLERWDGKKWKWALYEDGFRVWEVMAQRTLDYVRAQRTLDYVRQDAEEWIAQVATV